EDGIRDRTVTGVQTCALPISGWQEFRYLSSVRLEPKEFCGAGQKIRVGTRCAGDEGRIGPAQHNGVGRLTRVQKDGVKNIGRTEIGRASCRERVEMMGECGGV